MFSLFFYAYGGFRFLPIIFISIAANYVFGLLVAAESFSPKSRKLSVCGAVICNIGLLSWFKYAGFFAKNLNLLGLNIPIPDIVLPIGISFYTFQGLSYVLDVYRGNAKSERSIFKVALYITLFSQLVAGPIVRYSDIADEISSRNESVEELSQGGVRFLFGLAKKVLIANQLGQVADAAFATSANDLTAGFAWLGILAYTAQIYFDFSGYSDMAIGLGKMFGFHFVENFNYPYIAQSITDFWRRWHISLSTWFRDYLYIPLGGSRGTRFKQIRNLLIVWLLTGFWHGAAWNFVLWGLFYAVLLIGERYLWGNTLNRVPAAFRHVYALIFVIIGWVIFRSQNLGQVYSFLSAMFGSAPAGIWDERATYYLLEFRWEFILAVFAALPLKTILQNALSARQDKVWANCIVTWGVPVLALALGFLSVMRLVSSSFNPFIYFQF